MTIKFSTGLRTKLAGQDGFSKVFDKGVIDIFSGPQPVNADAAATGTLLGTITVDGGAFVPGAPGNGLSFAAAVAGVAAKAAEVWKLVGVAQGTAGYFRLRANAADAGAVSTTLPRMDGTVGTSGADMNLSNIVIEVGTPVTIDVFQFTIPAQ